MNGHIKHIVWAGLLGSSLIIGHTGCTTNRPLWGGANKPPILRSKVILVFNYTDSKATNYYLTFYNAAAVGDGQQSARNQILNDLMTLIDSNYHQFEDNLRGDKATQELGADIATLGLTAASTVVGGAETKTILSAIATGVVGVNSSIDKEVFQNNTVQALQLQMRAARSAVETKLINGMKQEIKDYPLQYGIRDIVAYYYAGSLNDALLGLVQNSSIDAQTSQTNATSARAAGAAKP
jgi:hypothetical protein